MDSGKDIMLIIKVESKREVNFIVLLQMFQIEIPFGKS